MPETLFKNVSQIQKPDVVFKEIPLAGITPTGAFQALADKTKNAALLDSGLVGHQGRFSFLHLDPFLEISSKGRSVTRKEGAETRIFSADPFEVLRTELQTFRPGTGHFLSRYAGGLIGCLGYGCVGLFEELPDRHLEKDSPPDLVFRRYRQTVAFDHSAGTVVVSSLVLPGEGSEKALKEIENISELLTGPAKNQPCQSPNPESVLKFEDTVSDPAFEAMVKKAKNYIVEGDIFQVVLSRSFKAKITAHPFQVYRALKRLNPSPFMFYLDLDGDALVGSSPEKLVSLEGSGLESSPLAGTRPRGPNLDDQALESDLINDPKERAEHMMLVDLARNDLGAISAPGSVEVKKLMEVEKFARVMHISSTVQGSLAPGKDAFDALKYCLPAGTLSGAPKIRAMEIIDELEIGRRNFYGGAVCAIDHDGNLNSCITIRTMEFRDGVALVRAGAGVVAESDPRMEARETRHKAAAVLEAIALAEGGL